MVWLALWDLSSQEFLKIESCYNRSVKIIFDLPYDTKRFLIEHISRYEHIRTMIIKRYIKFLCSLSISPKPIIKTLFRVCKDSAKSTTGRNIRSIKMMTGLFKEIAIDHASLVEYLQINDEESWRTEVIEDLLQEAEERLLDDDERELLHFVCSS